MSVVRSWRRRSVEMAREGFRCGACEHVALVARRACAGCGSLELPTRVALPRRGRALAVTAAGASVEHLDQVTGRKAAVLLDLGGSRIACLVADQDAGRVGDLRGLELRLAVRRIPLGRIADDEPIPYGLKAAADLATRLGLRSKSNEEKGTK